MESVAADAVAALEVAALVVDAAFVVEAADAEVVAEVAELETTLLISASTDALKAPVMPVKLCGFRAMGFGSKQDGGRAEQKDGQTW